LNNVDPLTVINDDWFDKKKPKSKIRQAFYEPTDLNKLKSKSKKRRHSKMNRLSSSMSHQIEC
jgi:hypothetical protein